MKFDKPITNARYLLGAVGEGVIGLRIEGSKDHVASREKKTISTPARMLKAMRQSDPMPDGTPPTMVVSRAVMARDCLLRRANPKHPEKIDRFILGVMAAALEHDASNASNGRAQPMFARREALAAHLEVPEHFVSQSFERLNKLGILGPERNAGAHDTTRGGMMGGPAAGWSGSIRDVNVGKLTSYLDESPLIAHPMNKKRSYP